MAGLIGNIKSGAWVLSMGARAKLREQFLQRTTHAVTNRDMLPSCAERLQIAIGEVPGFDSPDSLAGLCLIENSLGPSFLGIRHMRMSPAKWKALKAKLDRALADFRASRDIDQQRKYAARIRKLLRDVAEAIEREIKAWC